MNPLIHIFLALLLFQQFDGGFTVDNIVTKATIKASTVVEMVKCQLDFYYKSQKPPKEMKDKSEEREFYLEPHFAYGNLMEKCMKDHQAFNEAKKEFFNKAEIDKWIKEGTEYLDKEYEEIGQQRGPDKKVFGLKHWRRLPMPYGLAVSAAHLKFGHALLDKLLTSSTRYYKKQVPNMNFTRFHFVFKLLGNELENNLGNLKYGVFLAEINREHIDQFWPNYKALESLVENNIEVDFEGAATKRSRFKLPALEFPKVKRVFWVVRHGAREDNAKKMRGKPMTIEGRTFQPDNSPLSERGKELASRVAKVFQHIPISHVFASPYERTVDSAHRLLAKNHEGLDIKLEPGFLELLPLAKQLSFQESAALREEGKYERLNEEYESAVTRAKLKECFERETSDDDGSVPRVEATMEALFGKIPAKETAATADLSSSSPSSQNNPWTSIHGFDKKQLGSRSAAFEQSRNSLAKELSDGTVVSKWLAPGEERAEHIVISTHGAVPIAFQYLTTGKFIFIPQSSISKFVQIGSVPEGGRLFDNIRMIYTGEVGHLMERDGALFGH